MLFLSDFPDILDVFPARTCCNWSAPETATLYFWAIIKSQTPVRWEFVQHCVERTQAQERMPPFRGRRGRTVLAIFMGRSRLTLASKYQPEINNERYRHTRFKIHVPKSPQDSLVYAWDSHLLPADIFWNCIFGSLFRQST